MLTYFSWQVSSRVENVTHAVPDSLRGCMRELLQSVTRLLLMATKLASDAHDPSGAARVEKASEVVKYGPSREPR